MDNLDFERDFDRRAHAHQISEPIEVNLAHGRDLTIAINYVRENWKDEGTAAVKIRLGDWKTHAQEYEVQKVPAFIIAGYPDTVDGLSAFRIHTIQAMSSESQTAVSIHSKKARGKKDDTARLLLKNRERLVPKLMEYINSGVAISQDKLILTEQDIALLLGVVYLEQNGVRFFQGIKHEDHPQVKRVRHNSVLGERIKIPFNYDELFGRWFAPVDSQPYRWELDTGKGIHVPHWDQLPAGAREILPQIVRSDRSLK